MAMRTLKDIFQREHQEPATTEPAQSPRCFSCGATLAESRMYERYRVCHACEYHYHLNARERAALLLDPGSFHEDDRGVTAIDPLSFGGTRSYRSRIVAEQRRTRLTESALTGTGRIFDREVVFAALDFSFLGGSVGVASGERLARAFEKATSRGCAMVTVSSTSGTRMQEGLLALMQMPRVVAAARRHHRAGLPHISILANPATGSAFAGFIRLADYIIAEPRAIVGYSAYRKLRETASSALPEDAHTAESHLKHGLIDAVVPRPQLRESVALVLDLLLNDYRLTAPRERRPHKSTHTHRGAWQLLQLSRHQNRPNAEELIAHMTTTFVELRGDRTGHDDRSVLTGIASLAGEAIVIIGQNRPHSQDEPDDGWISASGFRKAKRAIEVAAKFNLPVITIIDTAGAYPSLANEEAGLGAAIAMCTATMLETPVPTIAVIAGEANSEAAAALAVADRVLMLDNAVYTVMPPEEAATLAFPEGAGRAEDMAERLRMTSHDCLKLGISDATVPEPGEGAHTNHTEASQLVRRSIVRALTDLRRSKQTKRLARRYDRYRNVGSTRSSVRGRLERQFAHMADRLERLLEWPRRRHGSRKRVDHDSADIPV
jgi:acyl-CoA carboxylase subunit beta